MESIDIILRKSDTSSTCPTCGLGLDPDLTDVERIIHVTNCSGKNRPRR
jgi:hypothetical protein